MNFLDFLTERKAKVTNESNLYEAFESSNLDKCNELIIDLCNKKISGEINIDNQIKDTTVNGKNCKSYFFIHKVDNTEPDMFVFNYLLDGDSSEVYSIDFFNSSNCNKLLNGKGRAKSDLSIFTQGTSVAYFIPIICHVLSSKDYELNKKDAVKLTNQFFNESTTFHKFYLGAQVYNIIEGVSSSVNENTFHINLGHNYKFNELTESYIWESNSKQLDNHNNLYERINKEYNNIINAIQGGTTDIKNINMVICNGSEFIIKKA